jgi:hypothetical protein
VYQEKSGNPGTNSHVRAEDRLLQLQISSISIYFRFLSVVANQGDQIERLFILSISLKMTEVALLLGLLFSKVKVMY